MKLYVKKFLTSHHSLAPLALRIPIGIIFIAHGAQKLFGWFGGYGLQATGQWMESIGLSPGLIMALFAGSAEFFGGIFLLLGLLTRVTAFAMSFTMLVAIFSVHYINGLFIANNGYEFALALLAASVSLMISGSGKLSIDNIIVKKI